MAKKPDPRGIRNANPGNIRKSGDSWMGLSAVQNDTAFFQFKEPKFGVRALMKLMQNYEKLYGLNTISKLVSRWAPPNENNTNSYVSAVSKSMGVPATKVIDLNDRDTLTALAKAIIQHENGMQPYPESVFIEALDLAGVRAKAPTRPATAPVEKVCPCCGQVIK